MKLNTRPRPPVPAAGHDAVPVAPPAAASGERWLSRAALALILFALAVRLPLLVNFRLRPDEAEHLHAAWAIAQGQIPYRDFWQIHTPLLYYLMAPVFALMGEDLRIIYVGRGFMLLCILLILLQLHQIARQCFDALTGLLAVLLLSYLLLLWGTTYESRPDIPQTLLILVSLRRFMRAWERRSRVEFLASGALLGVAFWLLIKTLFPLVGLTLVFVLSSGLRRSAAALRHNLASLSLFLTAFLVPVLLGAVPLWAAGALPNFLRYALIDPFRYPDRFSAFRHMQPGVHAVFYGLAIVGIIMSVTRMVRARTVDEVQLSPLLAGSVTAAVYLFLVPAPYAQSALPFLPLAAMYGADVVRRVTARALAPQPSAPGKAVVPFVRSPERLAWAGLTALLLVGACVPPLQILLAKMPPLQDQWTTRRHAIRYVLALTSPHDSVFDDWGLYIFRPHATYHYRLAFGMLKWLRSGVIPEAAIMNDIRRSHCKVIILRPTLLREIPRDLSRFLLSHYVSLGVQGEDKIFVAGKLLSRADLPGNRATVSLIASAAYAVLPRGGAPKVYIDGQLYQAPLFLAQGDHQIVVEGSFESLTILYSRVLDIPIPAGLTSPDR